MEKHPEHTASFEYPGQHYTVKIGDAIIVDTTRAIVLKEVSPKGKYPAVLYFPVEDTRKEFLVGTNHHTFCPLKGEANYYSLVSEGKTFENAVWYYPTPLEYVKELSGYLSFYPDKVEIAAET